MAPTSPWARAHVAAAGATTARTGQAIEVENGRHVRRPSGSPMVPQAGAAPPGLGGRAPRTTRAPVGRCSSYGADPMWRTVPGYGPAP